MRDLDALLNSLVNIDRNSLIAILSSEAEAARQLVNAARQRTSSQREAARSRTSCHSDRPDLVVLPIVTSHRTCPSRHRTM